MTAGSPRRRILDADLRLPDGFDTGLLVLCALMFAMWPGIILSGIMVGVGLAVFGISFHRTPRAFGVLLAAFGLIYWAASLALV